ncbi:MAG: UDP-4-amino-4,6-dideoxy-N-acetyl-beta-L-altrosamine transaminase [Bacteroidales bacterium]|nr:UDP-4-amino-4,6-dideoxy-N-acetyl-beta-L-altrosamine transaminase [Bacteroidales bacterium]
MNYSIPYGRQHITQDDIDAVVETLRSPYLTQGPKIKEFEEAFAKYVDSRYAVAVNNATAGLHLAAKALNVQPGHRYIVTPMTFASSANCIRFCGGDVEFCDIDPQTYLMDLAKLRTMLESHPNGYYQGVVVVDFAGYPHDIKALRLLCDEFGLRIIEDACHAPGAYVVDEKGEKQMSGSGRLADVSVFSFHPVKHIATGEGGMVVTDNPEIYERVALYRTHGITKDPTRLNKNDGGWYYEMQQLGFNYRLTDIQAALGVSQLRRAPQGLERRQEIARRYDKAFEGHPAIKTPWRAENVYHAFHLYVIQVPDRRGLYDFLRANGIYAQIHYVPLHTMPYYKELNDQEGQLPVVEEYYKHCISLPMYPSLTDDEQGYVIEKVLEFVK